MGRLSGKVAIVTGGATGMGASHTRRLVEEGARVVIGDINDADGRVLAADCGDACRFEHLDVREAAGWAVVVEAAETAFGPPTVLVNNAGVIEWGGVLDLPEATFRWMLDINTVGPFLGMHAVAEPMRRAGGGSVINISSIAGMVGGRGSIAYTASKWAVRGMTKAAALELAPFGIRVNSVHPGVIRTPMSDVAGTRTSGVPPIGRIGEPSDVSWLVVYLASDESAFTTGTEHVIDGGQLAGWP